MNSAGAISKIYWPSHVCTSSTRSGYLIGWNLRSFTACIAAVVSDVGLSDVENALSSLGNETQGVLGEMNKICGVGPMVLGVCTSTYENEHESHQFLRDKGVVERKQSANLWMTIQLQRNCMPLLRSVYCCGYRYHSVSSEVVFYKQPNPTALQYLSLEPLALDTSGKEGLQQNYPEIKPSAVPGGSEKDNETLTVKNMRKVVAHSRIFSGWRNRGNDDMEVILNQMNSSYLLESYIRNRCTETLKARSKYGIWSALGTAFIKIRSAATTSLPVRLVYPYAKPALTQSVLLFLFVTRLISEIIFLVLNYRMPIWLKGYALKDLSAAAQQTDLRLQQFCFWPWQYMLLRRRGWKNTAKARAQYISFYNSLWLVLNDIILGVAAGAFLMDNNKIVADVFMEYLDYYAIDSLESMMVWLMGWPAGLKLNSELDKFLGDLFLWLIRLWAVCINPLRPYIPIIFYLIGSTGIGGASVIFALLGDFLSLMTLHVYWFYIVAARIYNRQLTILHSLFNLFQGKKHNTLRKRIDSCDYDLDQLLLGTVLFTLLTFLFPTVLVYYLTFSASRVGVIILQGVPDTILALLNHFPLFAIMLRLKDPERLPGGLRIDVCSPDHFLQKKRTWTQILLSPIMTQSTAALHEKAQSSSDEVSTDAGSSAGRDRIGPKSTLRSRVQTFGISTTYEDDDGKLNESDHANLLRHRRSEKKDALEYTADFGEGERTRRDESDGAVGRGEMGTIQPTGWPGPWRVTTYLYVKNLPTPMTAIFFQYVLLSRRIASHYLSFYVIRCLLHGEAIRPVERLQYPMLPERKQLAPHELWVSIRDSFRREMKE